MLAGVVGWVLVGDARNSSLRLLPDTGGEISQLAVSLTSARRAGLRSAGFISALGGALAPGTELIALSNDPGAFDIEQGARARAFRMLALPRDKDFTIWPQDPFLVLRGEGETGHLLLSASFDRADDDLMAATLAQELGLSFTRSDLAFEGGNVLADERWIFIGANTIRYNAMQQGKSDMAIAAAFADALGGQVLVIGSLPQPVPHIDMMLTPLGDGHLLVADLHAGAAIAAAALANTPAEVAGFEDGLARRLAPAAASDDTAETPALRGATARVVSAAPLLADYFDALSETLEARGYVVHRMPLLFDATDNEQDTDEPYRGVLAYPVLTYNNVLLEERNGVARVYLPQYGFPALDDAAREQWRALGYEVYAVGGYAMSALYGGALRCSAKVLKRSFGGP